MNSDWIVIGGIMYHSFSLGWGIVVGFVFAVLMSLASLLEGFIMNLWIDRHKKYEYLGFQAYMQYKKRCEDEKV